MKLEPPSSTAAAFKREVIQCSILLRKSHGKQLALMVDDDDTTMWAHELNVLKKKGQQVTDAGLLARRQDQK